MDDFWGDIYGVDMDLDGDKDFVDFMIMDDLLSEDDKHAQNKSAGGPRKVSPNNYNEEYRKRKDDIKAKKMLKTAGIFAIIMVVMVVAVLASGGDADKAYGAFELLAIILLIVLFVIKGSV